jgi:hypothetical protein
MQQLADVAGGDLASPGPRRGTFQAAWRLRSNVSQLGFIDRLPIGVEIITA